MTRAGKGGESGAGGGWDGMGWGKYRERESSHLRALRGKGGLINQKRKSIVWAPFAELRLKAFARFGFEEMSESGQIKPKQ